MSRLEKMQKMAAGIDTYPREPVSEAETTAHESATGLREGLFVIEPKWGTK